MMSYANDFVAFIAQHAAEKVGDSSRYSGSSRVHYGLSNPTMRTFVKAWSQSHADLTYDQWQATLADLYHGQSIEEVSLAGFLLGQYRDFRQALPLTVLDEWLGQLVGWREIDTTCQSNYTADDLLNAWEAWEPFLNALAQRHTIAHRRASLVLLVKPVRDSSDERLITCALANVNCLQHETDKLITKAISWLLREAIKRHRHIVAEYVACHADDLPAIAVREFYKKYRTGKK